MGLVTLQLLPQEERYRSDAHGTCGNLHRFRVEQPPHFELRSGSCRLSIGVRHAQQSAGGRRQNVADTGIDHAEMRILGVTGSHKPGSAGQIGILCVILQRSLSLALPKSKQPIERDLLDGAIICVGRSRSAITDNRPRMGGVCRVGEEIPAVIIRAVVDGKRLLLAGSPLETRRARSGMYHGKVDVGASRVRANHEFRSCSHEVVSTTVAPKHVREENELIAYQFIVRGELAATAERFVPVERGRSNRRHRGMGAGKKSRKFCMKMSGGEICVIGSLGDNVWHEVRRSGVCVVVELRANCSELCWERDIGADKLVGIFNTYAYGPMLVRVVTDA